MKNMVKLIGIIAFVAIIGFTIAACGDGDDGGDKKGKDVTVNIAAIQGFTQPVAGGTPVTPNIDTTQYTGTVTWDNNITRFEGGGTYTARIHLTAKSGFTFNGVPANFFTLEGVTAEVSNNASSGEVMAVFLVDNTNIYVQVPEYNRYVVDYPIDTEDYSGTIEWSPAVESGGKFAKATVYTATITLIAKEGFSFDDLSEDYFTVQGAESVTFDNTTGILTVVFFSTAGTADNPITVEIFQIDGVTPPVTGATPVFTITETDQFTGIVTWDGTTTNGYPDNIYSENPHAFKGGYEYTARIVLTAKSGYKFGGVPPDQFRVYGAAYMRNDYSSNVVYATFAATEAEPTYDLSISYNENNYTFPSVLAGYEAIAPLTITLTNIGNQPTPTNSITIEYDGTNNNNFTLSATSPTGNISVNGSQSFTITPKTGLAASASKYWVSIKVTYTVDETIRFQKSITFYFSVVSNVYIITGSGESFTATKGGTTVGTANQTINTVINAIRSDANGNPVIIQFGSGGEDVLNIGTTGINFNNQNTPNWGEITLTGKITSAAGGSTITIQTGLYVTSSADVRNSSSAQNYTNNAFQTQSESATDFSTLNITGGYVIAQGDAVSILSYGRLNIIGSDSSPNIQTGSHGYYAVHVNNGYTNISGGSILGTVRGSNNGLITVSENAYIHNGSTDNSAIYLDETNDTDGKLVLEITGGRIENTTYNAIRNNSAGRIKISSGTVSITGTSGGNAIKIDSTGGLWISDGTVSTTGAGSAVWNSSTANVSFTGGNISTTYQTAPAVRNESTGTISVSGTASVTSAITSADYATIHLATPAADNTDVRLHITGGTVENTADNLNANAIFNASTGIVWIDGGTVSAKGGSAVFNLTSGRILITKNSVVSATTGNTIFNASTGNVTIQGTSTVSATTGIAVYSDSTGEIDVLETATVTSANVTGNRGTIFLNGENSASTNLRLYINGGTVKNTATTGTAVTLANYSTGKIYINAGTITSVGDTSCTIYNQNTGALEIYGGTVSATGGANAKAIWNVSSGVVTIWQAATITGTVQGVPGYTP